MGEYRPSQENQRDISRDEVVAAYKKFVEQGIMNPDHLDRNDPEVKAANDLSDKWRKQLDDNSGEDEEAYLRNNLAKTMLFVDAGFNDPQYLNEVLHDWLPQDSENMAKIPDDPQRSETRDLQAKAINKIRAILAEQKKSS